MLPSLLRRETNSVRSWPAYPELRTVDESAVQNDRMTQCRGSFRWCSKGTIQGNEIGPRNVAIHESWPYRPVLPLTICRASGKTNRMQAIANWCANGNMTQYRCLIIKWDCFNDSFCVPLICEHQNINNRQLIHQLPTSKEPCSAHRDSINDTMAPNKLSEALRFDNQKSSRSTHVFLETSVRSSVCVCVCKNSCWACSAAATKIS